MSKRFISNALVMTLFMIAAPYISGTAVAQTIGDDVAKAHVGQNVMVQGTVANVYKSGKGTIFLNFGPAYPHETLQAVVLAPDAAHIGDMNQYAGKRVDVKGVIILFQGEPQIIVHSRDQLVIH
jgi:hypothetical protein